MLLGDRFLMLYFHYVRTPNKPGFIFARSSISLRLRALFLEPKSIFVAVLWHRYKFQALTCVGHRQDAEQSELLKAHAVVLQASISGSFRSVQTQIKPQCQAADWNLHDAVYRMSWHIAELLGFKTMQSELQRYLPSVSKDCWGLEKACFWFVHMKNQSCLWLWHHEAVTEIWRQACQWFGFAIQSYVVGVACLHIWKSHAWRSTGMPASLPVRLEHLFFTCRFCLQCSCSWKP